jgi:hypothetical protein
MSESILMLSHCHMAKITELLIQAADKYQIEDVVSVFILVSVTFWAIAVLRKGINMRPFLKLSMPDLEKPVAHTQNLKQSDRKLGGISLSSTSSPLTMH